MVDISRVGRLLVSRDPFDLWWLDGRPLVGCWYPAIPLGDRLEIRVMSYELCNSMTRRGSGTS